MNTATGVNALYSNTAGGSNTATGVGTLQNNTSGVNNIATGRDALYSNTTGNTNTAIGTQALKNNTTGNLNVALGHRAGVSQTNGQGNVYIGAFVEGVTGESDTIRIGNSSITNTFIEGISGATAAGGAAVFVTSDGHLGTLTSSARFKDEIKPMGNASEAILALRPVSFRYKKEIDPQGIPEFGLVAEEVEKVNPALVIRDPEGRPFTVRYEQVNAMLLNEFLKEHQTVQQQGANIARLEKQIEALTAGLTESERTARRSESVRGGLEASKFAAGQIRYGGLSH